MQTALMRTDFGLRSWAPPAAPTPGRARFLSMPPQTRPTDRPVAPAVTQHFSAGLCSVTFRRLQPAAIIGLARQAGLGGIEWGGDVHAPAHVPAAPDIEASLGLIAMTTRATGLDCVSYGSYIAPPTDDLGRFATALAAAERLGARAIRIWPGTRGRASDDYSVAERRRVAVSIRRMADLAAARGVRVALECHPLSLTDGTETALDLMETIAHDAVDLCWQPRPGLALDDALAEIAVIGRFVGNVHVFAWDAASRRLPLAARANWWRPVFDALAAERQRPDRWAFLEFVRDDDTRAFAEDAACLLDLVAGRG